MTPQVSGEEISRYTENALEIYHLPEIDTSDPKQVEERINWYFHYCQDNSIRAGQAGLCFAIGIDRKTFWRWANGVHREATHRPTIKKAQAFLETLWEQYMLNGKINPVTGIFLAKNNFGYTDKQELEVSARNAMTDGLDDPNVIAEKYNALPEPDADE